MFLTSFLIFLDFILRIYFGVRIIQRRLPVGVSWAWLCLILFVPVAGTIIYLYLGEYRLGRRRQERIENAARTIRKFMQNLYSVASVENALQEPARSFAIEARDTFFSPLLLENDAQLLNDADEAFPQMIADIDGAKNTLDMVFYIWSNGGRADEFGEALIRAATRGVRCRVLVDQIGSSQFLKSEMAKRLRSQGITVRGALTSGLIRSLFSRPDLRVHRKILVVDGTIAYTGSLNLADPIYFNQKVGVGQWVDALCRLKGPIVQALEFVFLADWSVESKEDFSSLERSFTFADEAKEKKAAIQCLPSGPAVKSSRIEQLLVTAIYSAKKEIILTTPYFVPSETLFSALISAASRGVNVTLIVPKNVDSKLTQYASRAFLNELAESGVRVALFKNGLLHTKSVTIDGSYCLFGSLNLDPRSLRINFEITVAIYESKFTSKLKELQNRYLLHSDVLMATTKQSFMENFKEGCSRLLSPLL